MYGLVNCAIRDLVVETADLDTWSSVCTQAEIGIEDFRLMEPYDDSITYALVRAAAEVLETPADQILEGFGYHWILYTGAEGWGPSLDSLGSTVAEFLGNLNNLHMRIQGSMPSLVMPEFLVQSATDDLIVVHYHSEREGLAPMVVGLFRGIAERCGEQWDVVHTRRRDTDGFDTFELHVVRPTVAIALELRASP